MVEYIERAAAIVRACKVIQDDFIAFDVKDAIKAIPAADVVPVRHGRWIVRGQDIFCSECNEESAYTPFGGSKFSRYCPNCGRKVVDA